MFHSRCTNARERLCTGFEAKVIRVFFESSTDHLWVFSTGRIRCIVVVNQTVSPPVEGGEAVVVVYGLTSLSVNTIADGEWARMYDAGYSFALRTICSIISCFSLPTTGISMAELFRMTGPVMVVP